MRVSLISALHNNLACSRAMLDSLLATLPPTADAEIILIDDASTDGTAAWLHSLRDSRVHVINAEQNLGFGAANNRAAAAATGEVLVLLNNDLVLTPGWFEPLVEGLAQCPSAGVIGNLQYTVAADALDHRGVRFDLLRRPYHDRHVRPRHARRAYSRYPAVTAACCALRREVFREAGGFDEAFRNGYEDIDLCLRLGQRGYLHYVANRSVVRHHVSISPGRFTRESANLSLFLGRWGWPPPGPPPRIRGRNYIARHWRHPWRYNGPKLILALALLATGRPCKALERRLGVTIDVKLAPSRPPAAGCD